MGSECRGESVDQSQWKRLTVVTLSYCGLTSSPFEFYLNQYEHQLKTIGNYFQELIEKELPEFIDKQKGPKMFGKIELKYKNRYSPMFKVMAGIQKQEGQEKEQRKYRFMNQQQFNLNWDLEFQEYYNKEKKFQEVCKESKDKLDYYKKNVRTYDFLMFKALLRYVYKQKDFQYIRMEDPRRYIKIISPLFQFSFLNQTNKLSKFQYGFRKTNPDVYFLQETSKELITFLQNRAKRNYRWIADDNGQLIIIKNETFKGQKFQVVELDCFGVAEPQVGAEQRLIKPIALGSKSKNFLFISLHFSSREEPNKKQMVYLNDLLQKIKANAAQTYKTVILGGNLNQFSNTFPNGFNFYPTKETEITTFKKRTKTQAQRLKNDLRDKRSIDKIITNQKLVEGQITLIDGTIPDQFQQGQKEKSDPQRLEQQMKKCGKGLESKIKMLLPCEIHPFDKFLVKTTIEVPNYSQPLSHNAEKKDK